MSRGRGVAICLVGLLLLGLAGRLALPGIARDALVDAAAAASGRDVSLERVSLGLFAGRVDLYGLVLAGEEGPALAFDVLSLRLSWFGLLIGRLHLTSLSVAGLSLRIASDAPLLRPETEPLEESASPAATSDAEGWPRLARAAPVLGSFTRCSTLWKRSQR